jgi:Lon protease-like protein
MFPLGTVLVPFGVLPLHVFEPRYRALVRDCLAAHGEFGVVLIERGSEVGGGDVRFDIGTVARIADAAELPDGRYALATVGSARFRVLSWLPDDPYPRAEIEVLDEQPAGPDDAERAREVERRLRRVLAIAVELGATVPSDLTFADDPVRAGWEVAAMAPLGPLDALAVLAVDDPGARLDLLAARLDEVAEMLTLQRDR